MNSKGYKGKEKSRVSFCSSLTMSGCAVGSDGQLLDASKIQFFNDVDDDNPISGPSNPAPTSLPIHPLFSRTVPTRLVAGSRRTTRVSRPSAKVRDADNAAPSIRKRKASQDCNTRPKVRQATILDGADLESDEDDNEEPPEPLDVEDSDDEGD